MDSGAHYLEQFQKFLVDSTMSESEEQAINSTEEAAGTQKTGEKPTENVASEEQQSTEVQQRSDIFLTLIMCKGLLPP